MNKSATNNFKLGIVALAITLTPISKLHASDCDLIRECLQTIVGIANSFKEENQILKMRIAELEEKIQEIRELSKVEFSNNTDTSEFLIESLQHLATLNDVVHHANVDQVRTEGIFDRIVMLQKDIEDQIEDRQKQF